MLDWEKKQQEMLTFLKRDKHKVLEGMCSEHMFLNDLVPAYQLQDRFSHGWWAVADPLGRSRYLLFHVTREEQVGDRAVSRQLLSLGVPVVHVRPGEVGLEFLEAGDDFGHGWMDHTAFLATYSLHPNKPALLASDETRDPFLQERAINFLQHIGILEDIYLQRYFANFFLTVYFKAHAINLDGFVVNSDGLTVVEVKYKYPDAQGDYGINIGQAHLFKCLLERGIRIQHFVIDKPVRNEHMGFLDVLSIPELRANLSWRWHRLSTQDLNAQPRIAPGKTEIGGRRRVSYIPVPAQLFVALPAVTVAGGIEVGAIRKRLCPVCGQVMQHRQGPKTWYWTCNTCGQKVWLNGEMAQRA